MTSFRTILIAMAAAGTLFARGRYCLEAAPRGKALPQRPADIQAAIARWADQDLVEDPKAMAGIPSKDYYETSLTPRSASGPADFSTS